MSEVKDYTNSPGDNSHYNGVSSQYGKRVAEQNRMQPNYCDPGKADGHSSGAKRNTQKGPR